MIKQVLFIQGGGDDGYNVDKKMVESLQKLLGSNYHVIYPQMSSDKTPDFGWQKQIEKEIEKIKDPVIVVAHSLGASLLLKYLSENNILKKLDGIFLIATPFWSGNEDWVQGLKLQNDFADNLSQNNQIFFYHSHDDEEVPFDYLLTYSQKLPWATFRETKNGGHQLDNNLSLIVKDILGL